MQETSDSAEAEDIELVITSDGVSVKTDDAGWMDIVVIAVVFVGIFLVVKLWRKR